MAISRIAAPAAAASSPSTIWLSPPAGADPDQPAQRLDRVVALQQDLERVQQADVEKPDDLLDQLALRRHQIIVAPLDVDCQVTRLRSWTS
nr:hypothetical protein GCM10020092_019710 [Actinoplanes digitatis]